MRTTVKLDEGSDYTDEFAGCTGSATADGELVIADENDGVITTYGVGDWHSFETVNEDGGRA